MITKEENRWQLAEVERKANITLWIPNAIHSLLRTTQSGVDFINDDIRRPSAKPFEVSLCQSIVVFFFLFFVQRI